MSSLFFINPISKDVLLKRISPRDEDIRGAYFRDTTAIIHSKPFRRLKHKTQVFFAPENDHICTRIEHSMHVATISATICKALNIDSDLAWAIGLGHDLGHTPFGHLGETVLANLCRERGGFNHESYSLRVVEKLIDDGKGLNLTFAVRDGIYSHCGERFEQFIEPDFDIKPLDKDNTHKYPSSWEGAVVRMSDKIAYMGRDLEDAVSLGVISKEEIPSEITNVFGSNNSEIINSLVNDLIQASMKTGKIGFSDAKYQAVRALIDFNYNKIYKSPVLSNYHTYFERILTTLYDYLQEIFTQYSFNEKSYIMENNVLAIGFYEYLKGMSDFYQHTEGSFDMLITDYIAGMTDDFAIKSVKEIMIPKKFENQFNEIIFSRYKDVTDKN